MSQGARQKELLGSKHLIAQRRRHAEQPHDSLRSVGRSRSARTAEDVRQIRAGVRSSVDIHLHILILLGQVYPQRIDNRIW